MKIKIFLIITLLPLMALATVIMESNFDNPTVINFDSLDNGTLGPPFGANPYPGITFSGFVTDVSTNKAAPFSGKELTDSALSGGTISADFSIPVNRVGAFVTAPGASTFLGETSVLTMVIYDIDLNVLDSTTVYPTYVPDYFDSDAPGFLGLESATDIFRVEFTQSGTQFPDVDIDLFRYEAIPEPGTILLFCFGIIALIRRHVGVSSIDTT